jgi:hypothetical protein
MTLSKLKKRIDDLEEKGSQDKRIIQFPELRDLMQIADTGDINQMYSYFDTHARQGIYPSIEERRAMIPEIFANRGDVC